MKKRQPSIIMMICALMTLLVIPAAIQAQTSAAAVKVNAADPAVSYDNPYKNAPKFSSTAEREQWYRENVLNRKNKTQPNSDNEPPKFQVTGDPVYDDEMHIKRKDKWIIENQAEYRKMLQNPSKE